MNTATWQERAEQAEAFVVDVITRLAAGLTPGKKADGLLGCTDMGNADDPPSTSMRALLSAYRRKRANDGLNGRCWDATEHYAAEQDIVRLEADLRSIRGDMPLADEVERCPSCGQHDICGHHAAVLRESWRNEYR